MDRNRKIATDKLKRDTRFQKYRLEYSTNSKHRNKPRTRTEQTTDVTQRTKTGWLP